MITHRGKRALKAGLRRVRRVAGVRFFSGSVPAGEAE